MLKSRYARANLFKCDFQLGIVEIFWFNIDETPVGPFKAPLDSSTATINFSNKSVRSTVSMRAGFPEWGWYCSGSPSLAQRHALLIEFFARTPILCRAGLFDITDLERYVVQRRAPFVLHPWRFPPCRLTKTLGLRKLLLKQGANRKASCGPN